MKNSLILTVIMLIFSTQLFSQKNKDAIYLKNGSQIFGKLEQSAGNKLAVRTSDGSLFVFDSSEVDRFIIHDNSSVTRKKQGFGFGAEMGFLAGPQNSSYPAPFSFGLSTGYTIASHFLVEAGSGLEFIGHSYSPLYLGFRYCFSDRKTSPIVFARAGYMVMISESNARIYYPVVYDYYPPEYWYTDEREYRGGPTVTAGFGTSIAIGEMETYLTFAYRHFSTREIITTSTSAHETYLYNFNRLEIKLGFRF